MLTFGFKKNLIVHIGSPIKYEVKTTYFFYKSNILLIISIFQKFDSSYMIGQ